MRNKNEQYEKKIEDMTNYDKQRLITGIENGWIDPDINDLHIYYKLIGVDEHPILTWFKKIFKRKGK